MNEKGALLRAVRECNSLQLCEYRNFNVYVAGVVVGGQSLKVSFLLSFLLNFFLFSPKKEFFFGSRTHCANR